LIGLLNSGIPFACITFALLSISTGLSSLLNATVPLFGAVVAWLWLKDRPHGLRILGLLIGFLGVAMLAWGKASFKPAKHLSDLGLNGISVIKTKTFIISIRSPGFF
jgi:drug/metabolite transporter (DMT)-like permease